MELVPQVFRPWFGRALTVLIVGICAISLTVVVARSGVRALWEVGPALTLTALCCWAAFWRPEVAVDDSGVRLVNVTRTVHVPWPAIQAIDTKWALTLITSYGRFTAWAAPAPGARQSMRAIPRDVPHLRAEVLAGDGIRPGDLPSSPSGDAAQLIRERWQVVRDAGHLDDPRLEHPTVPMRWHVGTLVAVAALAVAVIASVAG